jgi:hypothetical protein
MANAARTTTTFPTDATETSNARAAYITPLRAAFVRGQQIRAADINLLRTAITLFNAHTHSALDYSAIAEFGNNGPRTVLAANPRVSAAMTGGSTPSEVARDARIFASTINTYVNAVNATRDHTHVIFDNPTA